MSKSPEHTPTPWLESEILDDGRVGVISSANEILIGIPNRLKLEDRKFIVRACNGYDALRASHPRLLRLVRLLPCQSECSERRDAAVIVSMVPLCERCAAIAAAERISRSE